jgi:hypothetical protein
MQKNNRFLLIIIHIIGVLLILGIFLITPIIDNIHPFIFPVFINNTNIIYSIQKPISREIKGVTLIVNSVQVTKINTKINYTVIGIYPSAGDTSPNCTDIPTIQLNDGTLFTAVDTTPFSIDSQSIGGFNITATFPPTPINANRLLFFFSCPVPNIDIRLSYNIKHLFQ